MTPGHRRFAGPSAGTFTRALTDALALVVLAVAALTLLGCSLPGLDDRAATYEVPSDAAPDLALRVRLALRAAHFSAEVERHGGTLRVEAPRRELDAIVAFLADPPGLVVRRRPPRCATGCAEPEIPRWSADELQRAHVDERVVFARTSGDRGRAIATQREPAGRLAASDLHLERGAHGTLTVSLARGSPGEALLAGERGDIVVTDGASALYTGRPGSTLTLSFGDDLEAYERARVERVYLGLPELPRLLGPKLSSPPRDLALAASTVALPALLSLVYIGFVRRFDRAHPEPLSLVAITFVLGGLSTLPAILLEWGTWRLSPWLDPRLLTFGGQLGALPLSTLGFALTVGLPEEGAKLVATLYATRRREFDEPVDGVVYGVVSALGFAAAENVAYFGYGRLSPVLVVGRAFTALPVHMFLAGLWGYALGARLVRPRQRVVPWLVASALAHGLYDALLSTEGTAGAALFVVVALAIAFVLVLRAALRHGPVSEATVAAADRGRVAFSLGRLWLFSGLALLLPFLAVALLGVAASWEAVGASARSSYVFALAALVVAIGATVWGITATIPLDAVVDDHGVTFAGAVRAHSRIDAVVRHGAYLEVHSPSGDIELGPGAPATLAALDRALAAHRAEAGPRTGGS